MLFFSSLLFFSYFIFLFVRFSFRIILAQLVAYTVYICVSLGFDVCAFLSSLSAYFCCCCSEVVVMIVQRYCHITLRTLIHLRDDHVNRKSEATTTKKRTTVLWPKYYILLFFRWFMLVDFTFRVVGFLWFSYVCSWLFQK